MHILKYRVNWKLWLLSMVLSLLVFTVSLDFADPIIPAWNLFPDARPPTATETYGVKAAMLAIEGAAALFIGLIPTGTERRD